MLPMLDDPFKHVMVSNIVHSAIGICVDEVVFAFKALVNDLVVKSHHVHFTQINFAGANVRRLVVQYLLFEHLDEVEAVYASAVFESVAC